MIAAAAPLPRGRHRLSRQEVVASQRGRMLYAMAEAMTVNGYVGTPVADIIRRAGVSRETFYQQFASKQDCFVQALETAIDVLLTTMADAADATDIPRERFAAVLGAYLDTMAAEPALARVFLIDVYAAGPAALQRRTELQRRFVDTLIETVDTDSAAGVFGCEALVAAISSMVTARLVAGDLDGIRALRQPIAELAARMLDVTPKR